MDSMANQGFPFQDCLPFSSSARGFFSSKCCQTYPRLLNPLKLLPHLLDLGCFAVFEMLPESLQSIIQFPTLRLLDGSIQILFGL